MSEARRETQRMNLTMARIERLQPAATGRVFYHDTGCPGLSLCVTAGGDKVYYLYRWHDNKPIQFRIGAFPALNVDDARKQCRALMAQQAAGVDIRATRKARREEPTLGNLWERWEVYAKSRKRSWTEDERQYKAFLKGWASRRLSSIKQADVEALHDRVGRENGLYAANRLLALLGAMFNQADKLGFTGANPAKGIKRFREKQRDRFLQADELRAFFAALAEEPEVWQAFFLTALLTGARRANVQAMRWADLDLERGLWLIAAAEAKAGKPMVVPLSAPAVAILRGQQERASGSAWVFPSHGKTGHLVEIKAAWARILTRAGLTNCRPHDLRRSLGSWMAIGGASLPIVGKALGHSQPSTTAIYARLSVDPVKAAVGMAADAMLKAGGVEVNGSGAKLLEAEPADDDEPTEF